MKLCFSFFCNARYFICGLLVVLSTSVSAQENLPIVIPPSPTSVQFQRYGDHPVGHFTGVPEISIPIFTIEEGDITVPITMNYHASGFRRFEPDGHVGLGWTLNTGGMVSRQIRGLPDDLAFMDVPDASNGIMLPNIPYRSDYEYLRDLHSHIQAASNIDYQMDMYNYRFLGHSGRFVEDPNNSNERVFLDVNKVIMPLSGHMKFLDDKGIEYNFGVCSGVETQWFEYMRHNSSLPSYFETISTWHLSSILSARYPGRGVSYQYQEGKIFQNNGSTERNITAATWDYGIDCSQASHMEYEVPFHPRSNNNYRNLQASTDYARATYQSKFPSQITFSTGRISFHLSNDRQRLERIEIRNKQLDLLKRITFEYGTFNINTVSGSQYTPTYIPDNRSRLEAIVFRDETGGEIERYSFGYQGGTGFSGNGTDHWGFANADKWGGLPTYLEYISRYTWNSYGTVIGCDTYQWNVG